MNILNLVEELGLIIKKKPTMNHGGEYCSACPFCKDGVDRFIFWPYRHNGDGSYCGGRFSCPRHCGEFGDAINFLQKLYGLSYVQACNRLQINLKTTATSAYTKQLPRFCIAANPSVVWQKKAHAFVEWSHQELLKNNTALSFLYQRGFTLETIKKGKIGFSKQTFFRNKMDWGLEDLACKEEKKKKLWLPAGFIIPTFDSAGNVIRIKIRRSEWKDDDEYPKYVEVVGSKKNFSIFGKTSLDYVIVVESELDALLIQQFASDLCFCVAAGGCSKRPDIETHSILKDVKVILWSLDNDDAGTNAAIWWHETYSQLRFWPAPVGKSPGDALKDHGVNLRNWVIKGIEFSAREDVTDKNSTNGVIKYG